VLEPEEKKIVTLMQQLNTLRNEKNRKRKIKDTERRDNLEKKRAKVEAVTEQKTKERRKDYFKKAQQKASKSSA
jgi:ribosome biogenesis protein BMS1